MRERVLALVVLAVLIMGGVGQASHPMFFPLSEHTIAKEISQNGMPLYRTYTFTSDDEQVESCSARHSRPRLLADGAVRQ